MYRLPGCLVVALLALGTGCQSDLELRMVDGDGEYVTSYRNLEGVSIDSGNRRQVVVREAALYADDTTDETSILMYLSFPIHAGEGIDLRRPEVFLVWSNVAAEFSGLLRTLSWGLTTQREVQSLSGTFSGEVRAGTGMPREVTVTVKDLPVQPLDSPKELEQRGYADLVREHLHRFELEPADQP